MDNKLFHELLTSVQEAGKIMRGELEPSRQFEFDEPDVKAIREDIGFSQSKFAALIRCQHQNSTELGTRSSPSSRSSKSFVEACSC